MSEDLKYFKNNILDFSRMLSKMKFLEKDGKFNLAVLLKGDGLELDRTFFIEVKVMSNLRKDFDNIKEYKEEIINLREYETSVIGWNFYSEELEWREIFYSEIKDIIFDLNKSLHI